MLRTDCRNNSTKPNYKDESCRLYKQSDTINCEENTKNLPLLNSQSAAVMFNGGLRKHKNENRFEQKNKIFLKTLPLYSDACSYRFDLCLENNLKNISAGYTCNMQKCSRTPFGNTIPTANMTTKAI